MAKVVIIPSGPKYSVFLDQQKDATPVDVRVQFDVNLKTSSNGTLEEHEGLLAIPQSYRNTMGDTNSNNKHFN